jgi:hypothetical protein
MRLRSSNALFSSAHTFSWFRSNDGCHDLKRKLAKNRDAYGYKGLLLQVEIATHDALVNVNERGWW